MLVPELPTPSLALLPDERENPAIFLLGEGGSGEDGEKRGSQESSFAKTNNEFHSINGTSPRTKSMDATS